MTQPIQVIPAILTDNAAEFSATLEKYAAHFDAVDIDIAEDLQGAAPTVSVTQALALLGQSVLGPKVITWDLVVADVPGALAALQDYAKGSSHTFHYLVNQNADLDFLESQDCHTLSIGVVVDRPAKLRKLEFYERFPLVQIMTIARRAQGEAFFEAALNKVVDLREMGYTGDLGLDGGVNLKTAAVIKEVAQGYPVERVSVGSYFQKAEPDQLDLKKYKLQLMLNL